MKILLISHPNEFPQKPDFPPIGIAYLGAIARQGGHDVSLLDGGRNSVEDLISKAKKYAPDFIGVTCWTLNRGMAWRLMEGLQVALPNTFLAMGGPHPSLMPEHVFAKTNANVVVIGEGEETFRELLKALSQDRPLTEVKGIAFRDKDNKIVRTDARPLQMNLDLFPFPAYDAFPEFTFKDYGGLTGLPKPTAAIITSRGCVFDCSYCGSVSFWGKKWRFRSAQNVLAEIEWLVRDMGAASIYIFDDNFPVNKSRAMDICQGIIDRGLNIKWSCCSHVKMVHPDLLQVMKESGCLSIDFGVESGSDKILSNINKSQTREDIERAFSMAHEAGIKPRAYLMVGNQGETTETIDETIDLIAKIKPQASIGATLLWLLPGTRSYEDAVQSGFINDDYWLQEDSVPYNLQEYSYGELLKLRQRLMLGIARSKGGWLPLVSYLLKTTYYRYPFLSFLRYFVPDWLR